MRSSGNRCVGSNPTLSAGHPDSIIRMVFFFPKTLCSTKSSTKFISKPFRLLFALSLYFVLFQIKNLLHCPCCIFLCIIFQMRISVSRRTEIAMSQPFLNLFHRYAGSHKHRCAAVSELMKSNPAQVIML